MGSLYCRTGPSLRSAISAVGFPQFAYLGNLAYKQFFSEHWDKGFVAKLSDKVAPVDSSVDRKRNT